MTDNTPACFGAATVFSADSETCKKCEAYARCADASVQTLVEIRHLINVEDLIARHNKARGVSQAEIKKRDKEEADARPPGSGMTPKLPSEPVQRFTEVVRVRFEQSEHDQAVIAKMATKARPYAINLIENGVVKKCIEALESGDIAALPARPEWFVITLTKLMHGGFTRAELKQAMVETYGWQENTAASYVSLSLALLPLVANVQDEAGRIVLAPAVTA